MFRRECVEALGGFDESIPGVADRDLWFRISERYEIAFIKDIMAYYRIWPGGMSQNLDRMRAWQMHFVRKHYKSQTYRPGALFVAMASIYREQGDLLFRRRPLTAIIQYFKAVAYNPLNMKNVYMLLRAIAKPL
jgi:hypothetical protein